MKQKKKLCKGILKYKKRILYRGDKIEIINVTKDEKERLEYFVKINKTTVNELILRLIEELEDEENSKEIDRIMNDPNTKFSTGMEDLAKEWGIDYETV